MKGCREFGARSHAWASEPLLGVTRAEKSDEVVVSCDKRARSGLRGEEAEARGLTCEKLTSRSLLFFCVFTKQSRMKTKRK